MKCDTCGSEDSNLVYARDRACLDDYNYRCSLPDARGFYYDIFKCSKCGLVFADFDRDGEWRRKTYEDSIDDEYMDMYQYRYRNFLYYLRKILKHVKCPEPALLDIGANKGVFLKVAQDMGCRATGCELSKEAVLFSKNKFHIEINNKSLEECAFPKESFSAITLFDVLEHLERPSRILKIINELLKENGVVFISTPNISSCSAKLLGGKWWGFNKSHLYYYNYESLNNLMERKGFTFLEKGPFKKEFPLSYYLKNISFLKKSGERLPESLDCDFKTSVGDMFVIYGKLPWDMKTS